MPGRARPESTSAAASSWASTSQRTRPGSSTTGSAPTTPSTASSSDGVWIESSSATLRAATARAGAGLQPLRFLGSVSDPCFGLADSRRSPALAPATPQRPVTALFAAFIATMPVSDFFAPFIIGLRHHAFPMRSLRLPDGTTRRPPRSQRGVYVRAWGLRRRDVRLRLAIAAHPILPSTMRRASAHSEHISFGAQYPAHSRRYRRFTDTLTGIAARLAVNRGLAS